MEYLLVCAVALLSSGLTLFSGFGLGTLLLPAFLLFFPADAAVAMTAIVHFLNNLFKLALLGKHADWRVVLRFGIPAILFAFVGATVLVMFSEFSPLAIYSLFGKTFQVLPVNLLMGVLIFVFAILELSPSFEKVQFESKFLPVGGMLSGFFGGLSGHQGALRSAFLIRSGLSKEAFIATGVVIACSIDVTRLGVYSQHFITHGIGDNISLIAAATLSAFVGAFVGNRLMKKVTLHGIQRIVSVLLIIIAIGIGAGWL